MSHSKLQIIEYTLDNWQDRIRPQQRRNTRLKDHRFELGTFCALKVPASKHASRGRARSRRILFSGDFCLGESRNP
jgi:hypothetical protein